MSDSLIQVVIPARFSSTRLPGKPLADIAGLPMIVRTAQNALQGNYPVIVAFDDARIGEVLASHGIPRIQTAVDHENGTQRLSEVAQKMSWTPETIVVNVQGDEPLLPPTLIHRVAQCLLAHDHADVATLATYFDDEDAMNPNAVKVVTDLNGYALYFSRAGLPFVRDQLDHPFPYQRHIGIYAYRVKALLAYPDMVMSPLEQAEKLEQLRFLEHGYRIAVDLIEKAPPAGVDSPEDLQRVNQLLKND